MSTVAEETFTGDVSGNPVTLATSSFSTFSGGTTDALKFDSTILGPGPSMSAIYAGGIRQARWTITAAGTIKGCFFAQFNSNPPTQAVFAGMRGAGANLCQLQIQNAGTVRIMNVAAAVDATNFNVTPGAKYYMEWEKNAAAQVLRVYNEAGTTLLDTLTGACASANVDTIGLGNPAADTYSMRFGATKWDNAVQPGYPAPPPDTDTTDTYIWNGTSLDACDVYIWDGTTLVSSAVTIQ